MHTHNFSKLIGALALLVLLFSAGRAVAQERIQQANNPGMSSAHYTLDWSASGNVSGGAGSSAHFGMNQVTVGQAAANSVSATQNYSLCTGWECAGPIYGIFLPTVRK
jgi:hypothetical protein